MEFQSDFGATPSCYVPKIKRPGEALVPPNPAYHNAKTEFASGALGSR